VTFTAQPGAVFSYQRNYSERFKRNLT